MKKENISLFAVSFSQGFISPNIPIASFKQGDKDLVFLLDTGSDNNVLNKDSLDYIDHEIIESNDITHLSGVNGSIPVQHCMVDFSCDNEHYRAKFLIADIGEALESIRKKHCITIHGILGSNFLRQHNVILDFKNLTAYSNK